MKVPEKEFIENNDSKKKNSDIEQDSLKNKKESKNESKLDPTHFGDWQVDCRTIDF